MEGLAPLFATAAAPVPAGGAAEWFAGAGGARLRAALFHPDGPVRGSVVVSPGRTEPIEKYFEVADILMRRGFVVLVHDWRGHGLSQRVGPDTRGHARGWRDFLTDYGALLTTFEARLPK
ncbi:MAG TPA: alpha/beta hydrolase, partial [Caulobacteraceae bacterium]